MGGSLVLPKQGRFRNVQPDKKEEGSFQACKRVANLSSLMASELSSIFMHRVLFTAMPSFICFTKVHYNAYLKPSHRIKIHQAYFKINLARNIVIVKDEWN